MKDLLKRLDDVKQKEAVLSMNENGGNEAPHSVPIDFSKIRVGRRVLEDATLVLGSYRKINPQFGDKDFVLKSIDRYDLNTLREISDFYFKTSGIYSRLCRYMAYMYRYDWCVIPYINGGGGYDHDLSITSPVDDKQRDKVVNTFFNALHVLDTFNVKQVLGNIAIQVMKLGSYYGYLTSYKGNPVLQDLPVKYCRSRFKIGDRHCVEFKMSFFDDVYQSSESRDKILKLFPNEFKKGYRLYKAGKLKGESIEDGDGWFMLDPECTVKFSYNMDDIPPFISVIPAIIDLDDAQDMDRERMAQQLVRIVVQQFPLDKNGDLIFSEDEILALHKNAVAMLQKTVRTDVLSTVADVKVEDMSDDSSTTKDELEKVERNVFNEAGVSQLQFNSDGNIALTNSILNDEASMKDLILQFEIFLNHLISPFNSKPNKLFFKVEILNTTIYNYKEMAKLYKEQTQLGYSKMLPAIALGQSQSSLLAETYFENNLLNLFSVFIPPISTNTMSADAIVAIRNNGGEIPKGMDMSGNIASTPSKNEGNEKERVKVEESKGGRPQKPENEKSEKTLANQNSQ